MLRKMLRVARTSALKARGALARIKAQHKRDLKRVSVFRLFQDFLKECNIRQAVVQEHWMNYTFLGFPVSHLIDIPTDSECSDDSSDYSFEDESEDGVREPESDGDGMCLRGLISRS